MSPAGIAVTPHDRGKTHLNTRQFRGAGFRKPSGNPKGKRPSDVCTLAKHNGRHSERMIHPYQLSVELLEHRVLPLSDEGDCVVDLNMAGDSTAIVVVKHKRRRFGCGSIRRYIEILQTGVGAVQLKKFCAHPTGDLICDPNLPSGGH